MIEMKILGDIKVYAKNNDITSKLSKKGLGLLAYMLISNKDTFYREKLAAMLWNSHTKESAYGNLRYTVWKIRRVLNEYLSYNVLRGNGRNKLTLEKEYFNIDAMEFNYLSSECNKENLIKVASLYRGNFMENFYIYGATYFNDWIFNERENFQRKYFDIEIKLASIYAGDNELKKATNELNKLIKIDPLNEKVYFTLMKYQKQIGNRVAAVNTYKKIKQVLRDELNISPAIELQNLYNEILMEKSYENTENKGIQFQDYTTNLSKTQIKIFKSNIPEKLKSYSHILSNIYNDKDYIIDIATTPGLRIDYEGIFEILDGIEALLNKYSINEYKKIVEIISDIKHSYKLQEYHMFRKIVDLLRLLGDKKVIIKIWNLHYLDDKTIDLISFLYRNAYREMVYIYGIYNTNWYHNRVDQFLKAFNSEDSVNVIC
jgi:DNA-binding SARP family transcriptional activator